MMTLVTGAAGCLGAWVLHHLVKQQLPVVAFDIVRSSYRIDQLLTLREQERVQFMQGDITDFTTVKSIFEQYPITRVIHLAGVQAPFCRADPVNGALINVVGTVNLFEAARRKGVSHVAYASSIAIFGSDDDYPEESLQDDAIPKPSSLYGTYKLANEHIARIYFREHGMTSIGLRSHTIYGVGRDQGLTSDLTQAMLHAVAGKPYHINFSGSVQLHLASDVALQLIEVATNPLDEAYVFNNSGKTSTVPDVIEIIYLNRPQARNQIKYSGGPLSLPKQLDDSGLRQHFKVFSTPLEEGIQQTMGLFADLIQRGQISL